MGETVRAAMKELLLRSFVEVLDVLVHAGMLVHFELQSFRALSGRLGVAHARYGVLPFLLSSGGLQVNDAVLRQNHACSFQ